MSTVPARLPAFNMVSFAEALLCGPSRFSRAVTAAPREDNAPAFRRGGMPDESTLEPSDDDARAYFAELDAGLAEAEADHLAQQADELHTAALAAAVSHAKAACGNVAASVARKLTVTSDGQRFEYICTLTGPEAAHVAVANSPMAAVDEAVWVIDTVYLDGAFGGFRVAGVAFCSGFPHRSRDEARQIARRIAMNGQYLDELLRLRVDGVHDLRPRPAASVAA